MSRRSKALRFFDFSGGLNTSSPVTSLALNQALDLQNINLLPSGGFQKRFGNSQFNSSAMASSAAVHGAGYYRQSDGDEWLMAVCGAAIFKSEFDGTMDDITGAVTITTGQDNIWTHSVMNDISIWVGGAPDAPVKWSGSGNAAALAGSPPSGSFGLTANNRFFIGNTAANPSRIAWSILGNPEDWSGTGSGTQDVSANDGDTLVGAVQLGIDHLICFKQNSIHDLVIRNAPFPLFPIRRGPNVGAVSKRGIVSAGNLIYYITPEPRMKAFDGTNVYDSSNPGPTGITDFIDDVWDALSKSRLKYIQGFYYPRLNQIWWFCSNGASTTHNLCIIWDLDRKAWLRHTTGFNMNATVLAQDRVAYGGSYAGKLYKLDDSTTNNDASETSPGAVSAYWRTGWLDLLNMINTKNFPYVDTNFSTQSIGTFDFGYGFDFSQDRATVSIDMQATGGIYGQAIYGTDVYGGIADRSKLLFAKGNGKFVQFLIRNANQSQAFSFNGFEVPIKPDQPYALR